MPAFPYGIPVTFRPYRPGAVDSHGNAVDAWGPGTTVPRCAFDPGTSVESFQPGRGAVNTTPTVYLDPADDLPIGPRDLAVIEGRTYRVQGWPGRYVHPLTGWAAGTVVQLVITDG